MRGKLDFEKFSKLWKKATEDQKQEMFYCSLFDFKSFEEDARIELLRKIRDIQKNLFDLIKKIDKRFFTRIRKSEFITHVGNDGLLKFILVHELKKEGMKVRSSSGDFPDLIIEDFIYLEIKRQVTTKNMGDDFWGVDKKECKNLILFLMFPIMGDDNIERVKDLTNGYYFIKGILAKKRDVDLLICYPDKSNFRDILERVINCIKSQKWNKNE